MSGEPGERKTACECRGPGFCSRHRCNKSAHYQKLCATRADYFELWESGRGPRLECARLEAAEQIPARGLGDLIARALRLVRLDGPGRKLRRAWRRYFASPASSSTSSSCGCAETQLDLNARFPLRSSSE